MINIIEAKIANITDLLLNFTTTKASSTSATDYAPLKFAIDNQVSFICKNEESSASTKIDVVYETSPSGRKDYTYDSTNKIYTLNHQYDLSETVLNPSTDLLFVFIYSKNGSNPNFLDAVVPVYDEKALYDRMYNVLKADFNGCANRCSNVTNSTNVINMYNGFRLALNTSDYKGAINFWNKLNNLTTSTTSGCNCH